jgi:hypothetical protein
MRVSLVNGNIDYLTAILILKDMKAFLIKYTLSQNIESHMINMKKR